MPTLRTWIAAIRLRTLPLATASITMAAFLAAFYKAFDVAIFVTSMFTTLCLQVLSNLANDYGDTQHGADSAYRTGPQRTVQSGKITRKAMKHAVVLFSVLSLLSGVLLLLICFNFDSQFLFFLFLGFAAIAAAIKYTAGKQPYGYSGFGDLSVFLFFGWVGVCGSLYLYLHTLPLSAFLPASTLGFFSAAVLNVNNIRDIDADKRAGKKSIPVRIGIARAKIYHLVLLSAGIVAAVAYSMFYTTELKQWLYIVALPLVAINGWKVSTLPPHALDPYLKQMAIATLLFVLAFGIGLL